MNFKVINDYALRIEIRSVFPPVHPEIGFLASDVLRAVRISGL